MMTDSNIQPAKDEWERMLSGELYVADNPKQHEMNMRKRRLVQAINTSAYDAFEERDRLFHELFGSLGKDGFLEPPFNCDYGATPISATTSTPTWTASSLMWRGSPSAIACSSVRA